MNPVLQFLVDWIENRYPGAKHWIDIAIANIDPVLVQNLILQALHDLQAGMSFIDILKDLFAQHAPAGTFV